MHCSRTNRELDEGPLRTRVQRGLVEADQVMDGGSFPRQLPSANTALTQS